MRSLGDSLKGVTAPNVTILETYPLLRCGLDGTISGRSVRYQRISQLLALIYIYTTVHVQSIGEEGHQGSLSRPGLVPARRGSSSGRPLSTRVGATISFMDDKPSS
jgi:hypothetical protein